MRAEGIDVSHHKPVRDWSALSASRVYFIGVKATEGTTYLDPTFKLHRDAFRSSPLHLAIYYHFARPGDPVHQAERFMDAVGPLQANERLCLDLEGSGPTENPTHALAWLDAFYETLMDGACSDRRPFIYTSKRIWRMIGDPAWDLASEIDLWAPRYSRAEPELPSPWKRWTLWQYSDGESPDVLVTPGVGRCDRNVFNGDVDDLVKFVGLKTEAVT